MGRKRARSRELSRATLELQSLVSAPGNALGISTDDTLWTARIVSINARTGFVTLELQEDHARYKAKKADVCKWIKEHGTPTIAEESDGDGEADSDGGEESASSSGERMQMYMYNVCMVAVAFPLTKRWPSAEAEDTPVNRASSSCSTPSSHSEKGPKRYEGPPVQWRQDSVNGRGTSEPEAPEYKVRFARLRGEC